MTFSTSRTLNFTTEQLLDTAFRLAGAVEAGHQPEAAEYAMGRDFLNMELDRLQGAGVILHSVEETDIALTSGAASFALSSDILNILPDAQIKPYSGSDVTIPVRLVPLHQWIHLTQKTSTGAPRVLYLERSATPTVKLWPVPDAAMTLTVQAVKWLRDSNSQNVTTDLTRYWNLPLSYMIAAHVAQAKGRPANEVGQLRNEAQRLEREIRYNDQESQDIRFAPVMGWRFRSG